MRAQIDRPSLLWRAFALGGMTTLGALSVSDDAWRWWEENITDSLPRSALRGIFWGALATHVGEGLVAGRRARRAGVASPGAWRRTALLYGYPTLGRLDREIARTVG